jgi:hypothetical protein
MACVRANGMACVRAKHHIETYRRENPRHPALASAELRAQK